MPSREHRITDILRIFHGDGPTQQIEAGSKIGGNYPCVGYKSQNVMFGDLAYTFRADTISTVDRQSFVTKGKAWQRGGNKPLDNLPVKEL